MGWILISVNREFTSTPDSGMVDFSPMRLGAAKTARKSVKSPDEFEALGVEPVFPEKDQAINDAENRASFRSGETRLAWLGHFLIPLPALIFQFDVLDRDRVRISVEVGKYLIF